MSVLEELRVLSSTALYLSRDPPSFGDLFLRKGGTVVYYPCRFQEIRGALADVRLRRNGTAVYHSALWEKTARYRHVIQPTTGCVCEGVEGRALRTINLRLLSGLVEDALQHLKRVVGVFEVN
jgi:hypothetical protein